MRNYQRLKNNPYYLDKDTYKLVLAFISKYPRLKASVGDMLDESPPPPDGMPRGNGTGDPTSNRASRLEPIRQDISIIETALNHIPEEYRGAIMENIIKFEKYPQWADKSTFWRWKHRFIYEVYEKKYWYM